MSWVHNKTEYQATGSKRGGGGGGREGRKQQQQNYCNKQRVSDKNLLCLAEETARKSEICHNKHNNKTQMQTKLRKKRTRRRCKRRAKKNALRMAWHQRHESNLRQLENAFLLERRMWQLWDINERLQGRRLTEDYKSKRIILKF